MLPAVVGSLNYATTPVECCSDVWTNFLHCMTFKLLRCVPEFRLDPVCTYVSAHVCMFVCMFLYVIVCVLCVCPHMFGSVEYIQVCVCTVYTYVKCDYVCVIVYLGLFSAHIYKRMCVCPLSACARVCGRDSTCDSWKGLCVSVCACQGVWNIGLRHLALCPTPMAHTIPCSAL